jgi:hypothetical protein
VGGTERTGESPSTPTTKRCTVQGTPVVNLFVLMPTIGTRFVNNGQRTPQRRKVSIVGGHHFLPNGGNLDLPGDGQTHHGARLRSGAPSHPNAD